MRRSQANSRSSAGRRQVHLHRADVQGLSHDARADGAAAQQRRAGRARGARLAQVQAADQEMFRHLGVEPRTQRILALKSSVHFRADFEPIAREVLVVKSPGPALADPGGVHLDQAAQRRAPAAARPGAVRSRRAAVGAAARRSRRARRSTTRISRSSRRIAPTRPRAVRGHQALTSCRASFAPSSRRRTCWWSSSRRKARDGGHPAGQADAGAEGRDDADAPHDRREFLGQPAQAFRDSFETRLREETGHMSRSAWSPSASAL